MSANTTVFITYNTIQGYETVETESYRSKNDPSLSKQRNREALFSEARLKAISSCAKCWETDLFTVTLGNGLFDDDSRAFTKDGRKI